MFRDGRPAGTTTALIEAVRSITGTPEWPGDRVYAWGGGESRVMTSVRRHLRDVVGLARQQVSMVGYWRRDPHLDDDDTNETDDTDD